MGKKAKSGKQLDGNEVKKIATARVEPSIIEIITDEYGSFTKWVNLKIKNDRKIKIAKEQKD